MARAVPAAVARALGFAYRAYHATLRVRVLMPDGQVVRLGTYPFDRRIFVLCERDAVPFAAIAARRRFVMLVDRSRDGDWAAAALRAIGGRIVRGSSRHGGSEAMAALLGALASAAVPCDIVADGPTGPDGEVRAGAWVAAARTKRPVVGVFAVARHAWVVRHAWSRLYVPWPLSRVTLVASKPTVVSRREDVEPARAATQDWIRRARPRVEASLLSSPWGSHEPVVEP